MVTIIVSKLHQSSSCAHSLLAAVLLLMQQGAQDRGATAEDVDDEAAATGCHLHINVRHESLSSSTVCSCITINMADGHPQRYGTFNPNKDWNMAHRVVVLFDFDQPRALKFCTSAHTLNEH